MLSTYILCPCKRNHRVSTTALNAYSGVKNTLIHHGIDVVEKTSRKKKQTHALCPSSLVATTAQEERACSSTNIVVVTRSSFVQESASFGTITDQKDITN